MKKRYVFADPPPWINVLIKLRNGSSKVVGLDRPFTIEEFTDWALDLAGNLRVLMRHGKLKRQELEPWQAIILTLADDPAGKRELFLKRVKDCRACHRAFWPPKSTSRLCEICRRDDSLRKATK